MKSAGWIAIILLFQGGMLLEGDNPKKEIIRLGESLPPEIHRWKAEGKKTSHAYENFMENYMPDAKEAGIVQTEDRKWTTGRAKEECLFIVFDAPSVRYAKELMESVERRIEKS